MMCPPYFYMASPLLLVDHGAAATAVQKKACRAAAAYAAFAATATTAAAAASAVLLLLLLRCCCCCHIRVPLLRVPKKMCCASRCQSIFPFFDTRFVFFCDLTEFRRLAHRKHIQSDAGMNLAFFTVDGIIGRIICIANTLGPCCQWPVYAYYRLVQATSQTPQTGQPPIFAMTITTMSNTAVKEGDILVTRSHICSGPRTGACC